MAASIEGIASSFAPASPVRGVKAAADTARLTRVALFCGGRGSAAVIRNLLSMTQVELTLLVNAYDDGLSTGELRAFIPGMLGPSDFRKNLSYMIELFSSGQYALQEMIEVRLPKDIGPAQVAALQDYAAGRVDSSALIPQLAALFDSVEPQRLAEVKSYLRTFFDYASRQETSLNYGDCSLGNLIFAGTYLASGRDFNRTNTELARLFGSHAKLVNVSSGEDLTLVGLKEDGEILARESEVVGKQSPVPIKHIYLIDKPITEEERAAMAPLSLEEKHQWLSKRETLPVCSREALDTIRDADVIIYGSGTQHSSLLPSYRIKGVAQALQASRARVKAFLVNLHTDHDIQSLDAKSLVDSALNYMGDPDNSGRMITHILYNAESQTAPNGMRLPQAIRDAGMVYKGAPVIEDNFQNYVDKERHNGSKVVSTLLDLYRRDGKCQKLPTVDIYVDLVGRSSAVEQMMRDFTEIDWQSHFSKVNLIVNSQEPTKVKVPAHLSVRNTNYHADFSEVEILREWVCSGDTDYLITMTGDGEYALRDVLTATNVLAQSRYGAIYGSRTQSRQQFHASLKAAYGEGTTLYRLSFLGAFLLSSMFAMAYRRIFTDPLTGFRAYNRFRVRNALSNKLAKGQMRSAASVTSEILRHGVEIGEVPVRYRTFASFAKPKYRLARGWRNLRGIFG